MELTDEEKDMLDFLAKLPSKTRKSYLKFHPELKKDVDKMLRDPDKRKQIEALSDEELKNAILSSYAAKAYDREGDYINKRIYYLKKDIHISGKNGYDEMLVNSGQTSVGNRRALLADKAADKGKFRAYVFSDSKGLQPGLHTKEHLPEENEKHIGKQPNISNPGYLGFNSRDELMQQALKMARTGLLENYFGDICGLNESEFFDDFQAIYGNQQLTESLTTQLNQKDAAGIFNLPLRRIMPYSDSKIKADIKDKDNGKEPDDYKIKSGDAGLTLNYMLAYIKRNGKDKEKDFVQSKIDYFMKIQDDARDNKKDYFNVSFASVNAVYKKYLKYKNK